MGESDEKIDLNGNFVVPGFIDSHTHIVEIGLNQERVDLSEEKSLDEAKYYLEKEVEKEEEGEWVIGWGFDESLWKKTEYPTKEDLDQISEVHPIIIKRTCGHIAVANSQALERIDEKWERVDRESGLLKEEVVWNLDDIIELGRSERMDAIKKGIEVAHSKGITSVHDIVDRNDWEAYKELDEKEDLDLRAKCYLHFDESDGLEPKDRSRFLSLKGLKMFADGSIGGRTAALNEDYEDDPGNKGILLLSQKKMEEVIEDAEERDFQLLTHAIGDRAIDTVLDALENASQRSGELRHRIEHAEMLWDEHIKRIRELDIVLSIQPNFALKWSHPCGMNVNRLGEERLQKCNPYWDIQRALIDMAFGSNNTPMSPLFGMYSAINHPVREQRVSRYRALQSYTSKGAYASRDEDKYGTFEEGKAADFVVLSENPLDSDNIKDIEVVMTVVGGKIVYDDRE